MRSRYRTSKIYWFIRKA